MRIEIIASISFCIGISSVKWFSQEKTDSSIYLLFGHVLYTVIIELLCFRQKELKVIRISLCLHLGSLWEANYLFIFFFKCVIILLNILKYEYF